MRQDEIQNQLNSIATQLQSLNNFTATSEKIVAIKSDTKEIKNHLATLNGSIAGHNKRIKKLELWTSYWKGEIAVIGVIITIGIALLIYLIKKTILN